MVPTFLDVTSTTVGGVTERQGAQNSVLVVDDDADLRDSLADLLREEGYAVTLAANGREALDLLPRLKRPCGVLLDIAMPVMTGTEFYEAMRADPALADIPVAIFTCDLSKAPCDIPTLKKTNLKQLLSTIARLF